MHIKYDFYISSGWFSEEQEKARLDIVAALESCAFGYFSPKDEIIVQPNADKAEKRNVFDGNIAAIRKSRAIICSTIGKDMGSIFEVGYAHALSKPIIYYCPGLSGPFNLMLAETAIAVATTKAELMEILDKYDDANGFYYEEYESEVE